MGLPLAGSRATFAAPPRGPDSCTFARISVNYSADLQTQIQPCFFGGNPDCSQCGCAVSAGLHWIHNKRIVGSLKVGHLIDASLAIGRHPKRVASVNT